MSEIVKVPTVEPRTALDILESIDKHVNALGRYALTLQDVPRQIQSKDTKELFKALAEAQRNFYSIEKSGFIAGRNIPYAKIQDLVSASREALYKNNLVASTFHITRADGFTTLVTRLVHFPTDQYIESELPLLNGSDEQKRGSSITYAWRYTYAPLIGLVDGSYDDDGASLTKPEAKTGESTKQASNFTKK